MWKKEKTVGKLATKQSFSIVHRYIQHFNEVSGNKSASIRRRSKISGVMITQYLVNVPEGKSSPDFLCKPTAVTVNEGDLAVFKAVVLGNPKPEVTWKRNTRCISKDERFQSKYEESSGDHLLEIHNVSAADVDIYKCCIANDYGKAFCSASLNVTQGSIDPADFRKLLQKSAAEIADAEGGDIFWEAMLNADRNDYMRICSEFGVADVELILKKLDDKKKLKGIDRSMNSEIPYDEVSAMKCDLFGGNKDLKQDDTGMLQDLGFLSRDQQRLDPADVEKVKKICDFIESNVDFVIKVQEISATEGDDALFECVLTHPLPKITWTCKGKALEDAEKYNVTVSDHKLIHRLLIKGCTQLDVGIYSAVAGSASCSAWLLVEGNRLGSKKLPRKTTVATRASIDLEKVAREQQMKNREELGRILASVKAKRVVGQAEEECTFTTNVGDCEITKVNRIGRMTSKINREADHCRDRNKKKHKKSQESGVEYYDEDQMSADSQNERDGVHRKESSTKSNNSGKRRKKREIELTNEVEEMYSDEEKDSKSHSKSNKKPMTADIDELASDDEDSDSDKEGDSAGHKSRSKSSKDNEIDELVSDDEDSYSDEEEDTSDHIKHRSRSKSSKKIKKDNDPGVHFISGLSDVNAIINESAELICKLSSDDCDGVWFRDGKKISPDDNFSITQDGPTHKLVINKCLDEHSGKYRFEADGRKTEARLNVKDPPRINLEDLDALSKPLTIKTGNHAVFKVCFVGYKPMKIQWYREGEELQDDANVKIELSANHSRLLLSRCQRKDMGEIKIKLKNEHGFTEAVSTLIVLDKPSSPLGPAEVTESSATCIEFKWRPPKDDGGCPVINYIMERQQVGRNTWKKLGVIPGVPIYRDIDVEHGRKYCYRLRAVTTEGTSDPMETDKMQAGTLAFPGPPAPPKVVSAFDDCINISWTAPSNTGRSRILGYKLEKRKKGSNLWNVVNGLDELIKEKKYAVKDVVAGMEYEFRVTAINLSGQGEFSNPSEFVFARDPKKPPGKVTGLKVTETSYTHMVLTWTKPEDKPGIQDEAKGYFVEIRRGDCLEWSRCNITPLIMTSFSVKGLKSMELYWVRVIATNDGGESAPEELPKYVLAMPSPVRPKFTSKKMKSFMVVRAGNTVQITVNFEASPRPQILWLKDNVPVAKRVTISNSDESTQLLIPSSERSDSGIYSVVVKNLVGQETFSTEVRVTDDPKPPGPVELEENVPGTVTVIWQPSPDEKRDDRLYYIVSKLDSTMGTWAIVADRLFNNKFTVCNIMHGREYHFRVYARNDMGMSAPSESPTWGVEKKKEKFMVNVPTIKDCDMQCPPTFIVPLKLHALPKGYECSLSCAVKGNPTPRITWYRNHISINTNTNYYISNTCGVCSMLILRVGPKDTGEYSVTAENSLGRAESSTILTVTE
ncbi:immunoglobulin-like and fibronectin type III domain-containing protein 1 [Gouania willdenowi]|uniref:immunoglobulin-like and fibronectin type III domain-containing protein 1 n=1 Tax=Gouania willdenowi TaxID=441366 RepID=UPI001055C5C2|nr:immunoglobulin-like and fibronectin type III domain-containing protein 1 [Gouania willdenowi]